MKFPLHGLPAPVRKKDITRTRVCFEDNNFLRQIQLFSVIID